jgi:hypothetical protein
MEGCGEQVQIGGENRKNGGEKETIYPVLVLVRDARLDLGQPDGAEAAHPEGDGALVTRVAESKLVIHWRRSGHSEQCSRRRAVAPHAAGCGCWLTSRRVDEHNAQVNRMTRDPIAARYP